MSFSSSNLPIDEYRAVMAGPSGNSATNRTYLLSGETSNPYVIKYKSRSKLHKRK